MINEELKQLRSNSEAGEHYFAQKIAFTISPISLKELEEDNNIRIIDPRDRADYEIGHLPNAISLPYNELENKLSELSKEDIHIVYGYDKFCQLGTKASLILTKHSFSAVELIGGFQSWAEEYHFAVAQ